METIDDLLAMARIAGRSGRDWDEWTSSDEVQLVILALGRFDTADIERAYADGRLQWCLVTWRVVWTTAPSDYDNFGTATVEQCGDWYGKQLRRVIIEPEHFVYQTSRYSSGLHPSWEMNPRVEEARAKESAERDRAERAAYEEKRQTGLVWLTTVTDDELCADDEIAEACEVHGVKYNDVRDERKRRAAELADNARAAEWTRCLAIVPEGATLIDAGESSQRGKYGVIPGRAPHVYYHVNIVHAWPDDADHANVMGEGNDNAGSLALVADWITSGRLRIATPDDVVPPIGVLNRVGHEHLRDIRRVEVDGRTVWVGRQTFGETLVLDDAGRIVRSKKIVAAAMGDRR